LAAAERARNDPAKRPAKEGRFGNAPAGRRLRLLTTVLGVIAAALVLVIGAGTLYVLLVDPGAFSGASARAASWTGDNTPAGGAGENTQEGSGASETGMFTGIGRMRITAGRRATVVLSIVFPYPSADRPFTEELAAKVPVFRQIAGDYFGTLSQDELDLLDEQRAKTEILRRFNDELRLGQIESLLFNDLLILE
jgi:flagellar basal body-associated protein FliL